MNKIKTVILSLIMMCMVFLMPRQVYAERGELKREKSMYTGRMEFRYLQATQNTYEDYMILKMDNQAVFCVDPAMYVYAGEYTGSVFSGNDVINSRVTITWDTKAQLERIVYFGYKLQPNDKNYHYTQALVWETLGYKAQSFTGGLSLSDYQSWKESILRNVDNYHRVVSFNGESYVLKIGESITLTDTNNVLQNLNVAPSQNGFDIVKNNNQVTITATANAQDGKLWWSEPSDSYKHGVSILYRKANSQTVGSFKLADPQYGEVNVVVEKKGIIELFKTSSSTGLPVKGVEYTLYDKETNTILKTQITNGDGWLAFLDLEPGKVYSVKEKKTVDGYYLSDEVKEHQLLSGEKYTMQFVNTAIPQVNTQATTVYGNKEGYVFEKHKEVATFTELTPNVLYETVVTQYDITGKVLGAQKRQFTPTKDTHIEEFIFDVPADFAGDIVYGEDLYRDGTKVAVHYDLTNRKQTVNVLAPKIQTMAQVNGKTSVVEGTKSIVTDTLDYSGFKAENVLIKTWIVKYGTDEKVSEVFERIVKLDGNGQITVTLDDFDTSKLVEGKYTLMEEVYVVKEDSTTDKLIAKHTNNKDNKQTFTVVKKTDQPQLPHTGQTNQASFTVGIVFIVFALSLMLIENDRVRHKK